MTRHDPTAALAARKARALEVQVCSDGVFLTRAALVRAKVAQGYRVVPHAKDGRRLMHPDGRYIEQARLTSFAMDYASDLLEGGSK